MSDSVQRAFRLLVARFKKPEGNASTTSHTDSTSASTSTETNTSPTSASPVESTTASPHEEVPNGPAVPLTSDSAPSSNSTGQASTSSQFYTTAPVNDPSDPSTSHVAEFQISDPSLSISDRPVSEDGGPASERDRPSSSTNNANNTTLSRSIAVTMNLTVNVRHHNHHHRHHLPPVHFFGPMDDQTQAANGHGHHQHAPMAAIGVGFIDPVNPLLARARHRLYSLLLLRAAMAYFLAIPPLFRKCFEYSVLATAISAFALLIHLHVTLIRSPLTCLDHVADSWPRDGILRVQISMSKDHLPFDLLPPSKFISEEALHFNSSTVSSLPFPLTYAQWRSKADKEVLRKRHLKDISEHQYLRSQFNDSSLLKEADALRTLEFYPKKHGLWPQPYMVEYSLEYGLLRLSEEMRAHYNVPLKVVSLCPDEDACFGDPLARFILYHFLGYDDVLIGSIKRLAEKENNRGYVRNVATGEHFRFVNVWMTRASYIAAAFIMIVFTLFVSMLIRYSHQQVFVFVSEFLRTVEMQQPMSRITMLAASLITVVLALIGMEAIMFEFFNDSSIAFHVIIMVWAADQFDSMAARSVISKRHFLRFFYLYQFAFYAYHYRFNGQYAGLALMVTMLFTYHSMIFFFHHYELPLVQAMEETMRFERRQRANGGGGGDEPPRGPDTSGDANENANVASDNTESSSTNTDETGAASAQNNSSDHSTPLGDSEAVRPPPTPLPAPQQPHPHHHHHFTIRHHLCSAQCQSHMTTNRFPFGSVNATRRPPQEPSDSALPPLTSQVLEVEVD